MLCNRYGDEPPVHCSDQSERMANPVCEVQLTEDPLQLPEQQCCGTGAVVDFFGVVRPLELNQEISGIDYQAHESMALHQLEVIARDAIAKFALDSAIVYHRIGFVAAGEASVVVRTSSRHRAESYQANEWIMDQLKTRVPIWKEPRFKQPKTNLPAVAATASQT